MGDICDMADLERFMRSDAGKETLEETRSMLKGRTIVDIEFRNEVHFIVTELLLDNGERFAVFQPSLEVGAIREQFEDVLEEEYFRDFPERRPMDDAP